jgi:hypothetical protein
LLESGVHAHIGSSEKVNNRYYKLAPMADRVRIVYTIFFGREPSAELRREMDTDRDGMLSASEVATFAGALQSDVVGSTAATLGANDTEIYWQPIDLGIGRATTSGGAFSADLVGTVCLTQSSPTEEHRLIFVDGLVLPKPGESELRLDPAPGIRIVESRLGGREVGAGHKWQGGAGPVAQGYQLSFLVERDDSAGLDDLCKPPPPEKHRLRSILVGGAVLLLLAAALGLRAFRRRR